MKNIANIKKLTLLSSILIPLFTSNVWATTYLVINTLNAGPGSLRQAVLDANANPGLDMINFAIPMSDTGCNLVGRPAGVCTIPLISEILVTDPVTIDGYTQPGTQVATSSVPATLKIEVIAGNSANGIHIQGLSSSGSTVMGLNVHGSIYTLPSSIAPLAGMVRVTNSDNNKIVGNYLGTDVTGQQSLSVTVNNPAITFTHTAIVEGGLVGTTTIATNNIVGGPNVADRNILSGTAGGVGVFYRATGTKVIGNYMGTNANGTAVPSGPQQRYGFITNVAPTDLTTGANNTTITDNLISGNGRTAIFMAWADNYVVSRNRIGINSLGAPLPNGGGAPDAAVTDGTIDIRRSINAMIGGYTAEEGNIIANNLQRGIQIISFAPPNAVPRISDGNRILSNSIYNNNGLGIDLVNSPAAGPITISRFGPTLNDILDVDSGGGNNFQNFPVINAEKSFINPSLVQIWGSLDSKPNQDYLIQVFASVIADPSGFGEGQVYIGSYEVHTDANGHVDFHFPAKINAPSVNGVPAPILTATATDVLTGDTSEFSASVNIDPKGSPTAYENANGAAGGDGGDMESPG